ncbi:glycoside hydrolase family protein [Acinetobacter sp. YIM 103518]|uniref:Lysozyme n=1 Tax=Acinetobacter faecalis TaxID=2665161 RepID=A0A6L6GB66_9GAMM|nr:lysozyme [Acinetobacter faecalis]MTD09913.1 glycoside hydrolase family protein [Acinetobacter faecalis]
MQNKTKIAVGFLAASAAFFTTLEKYEGFSAKPYKDSGGVVTQGIGSLNKPDGTKIKMTDPLITRKTAQEWAKAHVSKDEIVFRKSLDGVKLSQVEYDVYLDFMYNFGQGNWRSSSMLRNLKTSKYKQACDSLLKYKYVAKRDCSIRKNNCYGVWTRQLERHQKCMRAQ